MGNSDNSVEQTRQNAKTKNYQKLKNPSIILIILNLKQGFTGTKKNSHHFKSVASWTIVLKYPLVFTTFN